MLRTVMLSVGCAATGFSAGFFVGSDKEKRKLEASWTTNFNPSVKWDYNWDKRDPESLVKPPKNLSDPSEENKYNENLAKVKPTASRHIILVRHGQYNMAGKDDTAHTLTALGQEQALLAGIRLQELNLPNPKIIQSSMTRAKETASLIMKNLENINVTTCDFLREGAPIPPEPPVGHWRPEVQQFFIDGARIEAAFRKYFHRAEASQQKDSCDILVCHGNVIRYFICRAMQFPPEAWLRFSLHHSSISWLVIRPSGRVSAYLIGDVGHLPRAKMTTS